MCAIWTNKMCAKMASNLCHCAHFANLAIWGNYIGKFSTDENFSSAIFKCALFQQKLCTFLAFCQNLASKMHTFWAIFSKSNFLFVHTIYCMHTHKFPVWVSIVVVLTARGRLETCWCACNLYIYHIY